METTLYYFSGRGNSLKTALDLAQRIEDCRLVAIRHDMDAKDMTPRGRIGIITPVIDVGVPAYVLEFIGRLRVADRGAYIFAAVTNGGLPCAALNQIRRRLKRRGLALQAGFLLKFGREWDGGDEWRSRIDEIADIVRRGQKAAVRIRLRDRLLTGLGNSMARMLIPSEDKKFRVTGGCNGCGVCQSLCPAANIKLTDGRPIWLHHCTQCAACCNWCPQTAIEGTNLAARSHFTNP
jgi:ferredoxin